MWACPETAESSAVASAAAHLLWGCRVLTLKFPLSSIGIYVSPKCDMSSLNIHMSSKCSGLCSSSSVVRLQSTNIKISTVINWHLCVTKVWHVITKHSHVIKVQWPLQQLICCEAAEYCRLLNLQCHQFAFMCHQSVTCHHLTFTCHQSAFYPLQQLICCEAAEYCRLLNLQCHQFAFMCHQSVTCHHLTFTCHQSAFYPLQQLICCEAEPACRVLSLKSSLSSIGIYMSSPKCDMTN